MSAVKVVAEAQRAHSPETPVINLCRCGEWNSPRHQAEVVVAALRAASPQVQADAIGGEVETAWGGDYRAAGPWFDSETVQVQP